MKLPQTTAKNKQIFLLILAVIIIGVVLLVLAGTPKKIITPPATTNAPTANGETQAEQPQSPTITETATGTTP